jgi:bacteriorhodopsin
MKSLLPASLYFSLTVQVISILIGLYGLTFQLKPEDEILSSTIGLETIVSTVQLSFYTWYSYHFKEVAEATFYRYYDWFITTPIMLFTTILYYDYNNNPDEKKTIGSIWNEHKGKIILVFLCNAVMLIFGYLYEVNILDLFTSNLLGFAGLFGSFYIIYDSFVKQNLSMNLPLFIFMLLLWSFYGIAATFTPTMKNITYNLIDTLSKNFYGVFLTYVAYTKSVPISSETLA